MGSRILGYPRNLSLIAALDRVISGAAPSLWFVQPAPLARFVALALGALALVRAGWLVHRRADRTAQHAVWAAMLVIWPLVWSHYLLCGALWACDAAPGLVHRFGRKGTLFALVPCAVFGFGDLVLLDGTGVPLVLGAASLVGLALWGPLAPAYSSVELSS